MVLKAASVRGAHAVAVAFVGDNPRVHRSLSEALEERGARTQFISAEEFIAGDFSRELTVLSAQALEQMAPLAERDASFVLLDPDDAQGRMIAARFGVLVLLGGQRADKLADHIVMYLASYCRSNDSDGEAKGTLWWNDDTPTAPQSGSHRRPTVPAAPFSPGAIEAPLEADLRHSTMRALTPKAKGPLESPGRSGNEKPTLPSGVLRAATLLPPRVPPSTHVPPEDSLPSLPIIGEEVVVSRRVIEVGSLADTGPQSLVEIEAERDEVSEVIPPPFAPRPSSAPSEEKELRAKKAKRSKIRAERLSSSGYRPAMSRRKLRVAGPKAAGEPEKSQARAPFLVPIHLDAICAVANDTAERPSLAPEAADTGEQEAARAPWRQVLLAASLVSAALVLTAWGAQRSLISGSALAKSLSPSDAIARVELSSSPLRSSLSGSSLGRSEITEPSALLQADSAVAQATGAIVEANTAIAEASSAVVNANSALHEARRAVTEGKVALALATDALLEVREAAAKADGPPTAPSQSDEELRADRDEGAQEIRSAEEAAVIEAAVVEAAVVEVAVAEAAVIEAAVIEAAVIEAAVIEAAVIEAAVIEAAVVEVAVAEEVDGPSFIDAPAPAIETGADVVEEVASSEQASGPAEMVPELAAVPEPVIVSELAAVPEPAVVSDQPLDPRVGAERTIAQARILESRPALNQARVLYLAAAALNPRNPHAYAGLARIALSQGDAAAALENAQRAVSLRRRRARYYRLLEQAHLLNGDPAHARVAAQRARELARPRP